MSVVVKDRICRQCGRSFSGGPRAWYCPECRYVRRKASAERYRAKGRKADRPLGSIDRCVVCGKDYTVKSARQKYCPDCAYDAVRAVDRPESRRWLAEHKGDYYPARNDKRRARRYCIVCGRIITAKTCTVTCESKDCKLERRKQTQMAAEARRNGEKPPKDYVSMRPSRHKKSEGLKNDR